MRAPLPVDVIMTDRSMAAAVEESEDGAGDDAGTLSLEADSEGSWSDESGRKDGKEKRKIKR